MRCASKNVPKDCGDYGILNICVWSQATQLCKLPHHTYKTMPSTYLLQSVVLSVVVVLRRPHFSFPPFKNMDFYFALGALSGLHGTSCRLLAHYSVRVRRSGPKVWVFLGNGT